MKFHEPVIVVGKYMLICKLKGMVIVILKVSPIPWLVIFLLATIVPKLSARLHEKALAQNIYCYTNY